jgi:tRNA (guanine37-N1)-methyltransferase
MQSVLIDEEKFNKVVEGLGLVVPSNEVKSMISAHKSLLMSQKNLKIVLNHSDLTKKIILFDPLCTLPESLENYEKVKIPVNLNYSNFGYFEVLQQLLPETVQVPTGFETIGHIAHFNLAEDQLPFKHLIGSVLIDVMFKKKVKNIKTVVTKIGKIEHVYRTFQMEVIAGKDDLIATVVFGR